MFNVGGGEILVILLIALVVLGPDKLPEAARKAGKVMADIRKMSSGFQSEMRNALKVDEYTNLLNPKESASGGSGPSLPPLESEVKASNPASATSSTATSSTATSSTATSNPSGTSTASTSTGATGAAAGTADETPAA